MKGEKKCKKSWGQNSTHQFANERDGPLLGRLRHAVDAEGRVPAAGHGGESSTLNTTGFEHFTVKPFPILAGFTDPGLAHAGLPGWPSCSRF